ncbi:MAG: galactose oxidase [Verrucomicrobiales bacterium]|nr:galactose oxidase [Verrucomicrobiales bacterium]MCP5559529.1 galactose oxidase [Verrucomicrobiaceae bacterium]
MKTLLFFLTALNMLGAEQPWTQLPPIPDAEGFAAPFAGVSGGALIVAGGANIPKDKWADVFTKVWYDTVYVLDKPDGQWKAGGKLPRALGYGVSVTADDSVLCFGGSDSAGHYADSFRLSLVDGQVKVAALPALPKPCANACGALVERTVYIAGGLESPSSTEALHTFWALDLDAKEPAWQELKPWPGPERMLAVAGVMDGAFVLCSGVSLASGPDGKAVRTYLRDAYRFDPGKGWKRLADLPRAAVAAPSPAALVDGRLMIVTGDDGANVTFEPVKEHPGFPKDALLYDATADAWSTQGGVPFSRATACTAVWQSRYIVPNGEVRPRVRSPEVWTLPLSQ